MGDHGGYAGDLLHHAVDTLGQGAYAPDQAVLVDLANRRFYMFQIEIWPHEFYYVVGLLIMAGIGLFLVTSAVGRAWCGYSCPQTVWTDLFQHVERFIDGDRNAQMRLEKASWGAEKIAKRLSKWSVWLFIAFWTGGAWIMYFADAPTLVRDFWSGNAAPVAYATVGILTATTFVFGGFMREQVCIYMCPWPRIQTAMMDEKSLLVTYKDWRGEQRGSLKAAQADPGPLWRLHRLQPMCGGVPDGHRYPRRTTDRVHHLRAVHRCL
jgi:cytochrome c oxidase accessory protein FixG